MASVLRILPLDEQSCLLVHGKYVTLCSRKEEDSKWSMKVVYEHDACLLRAAALSHSKNLLLLTDTTKRVLLLSVTDESPLTFKNTFMIEKSAMVAAFSPDDTHVYIGDKFGDVIEFNLNAAAIDASTLGSFEGKVIGGCISMATDLHITNSHVYLADRDEKIRAYRRDSPWNIDSFLLHHSEYVAGIAALGTDQLVSIGGDGRLVEWNIEDIESNNEQGSFVGEYEVSGGKDPLGLWQYNGNYYYMFSDVPILFYRSSTEMSKELSIPLPPTFQPITLVTLTPSLLLISGKQSANPTIIQINIETGECLVIEEFLEHVRDLSIDSIPWSQIVRSHLRKQREMFQRPRKRRSSEDDNEQDASDDDEQEQD